MLACARSGPFIHRLQGFSPMRWRPDCRAVKGNLVITRQMKRSRGGRNTPAEIQLSIKALNKGSRSDIRYNQGAW